MSKLTLVSTMVVTALLISTAQAAPKARKAAAPVDNVQVTCKTTVKDSNGNIIGQRVTQKESTGVTAKADYNRMTGASGPIMNAIFTATNKPPA